MATTVLGHCIPVLHHQSLMTKTVRGLDFQDTEHLSGSSLGFRSQYKNQDSYEPYQAVVYAIDASNRDLSEFYKIVETSASFKSRYNQSPAARADLEFNLIDSTTVTTTLVTTSRTDDGSISFATKGSLGPLQHHVHRFGTFKKELIKVTDLVKSTARVHPSAVRTNSQDLINEEWNACVVDFYHHNRAADVAILTMLDFTAIPCKPHDGTVVDPRYIMRR